MKTPLSLLMLGWLLLCSAPAAAQHHSEAPSYPVRAVKVIVPNAAGSALDVIARIVAQKLTELGGRQFYVENIAGAGGAIGTGAAARAAADGYTILFVNQDYVIQPLVKTKVPYDPSGSFAPVASVAAAPETISVHPSLPVKNMKDLMALLKANPGKYSYASPGHATSPHIAGERFFRLSNSLDVVHVPYQGGGAAVAASIAGHTQVLHITLPLVSAQIKDGKLRGLAITDSKRAQSLPDIPTLAEAGFPDHDVGYWAGVLVPAGTPGDIVDALGRQIAKVVSLPDVNARLATLGFSPLAGTARELETTIKAETIEWARVVRDAKIRIE
jgi:tripartite-type tricarboxylate transporter receptor subunit TctC